MATNIRKELSKIEVFLIFSINVLNFLYVLESFAISIDWLIRLLIIVVFLSILYFSIRFKSVAMWALVCTGLMAISFYVVKLNQFKSLSHGNHLLFSFFYGMFTILVIFSLVKYRNISKK